MRLHVVRFRTSTDLISAYRSEFSAGGLFVLTRLWAESGEAILLDVRFPELRDTIIMRGVVRERLRGQRGGQQRAGLVVEFASSENAKRDHILSLARGAVDAAANRRHRRLPVELPVELRFPLSNTRHPSVVRDISNGGMLIESSHALPDRSPVFLEITPPGATTAHSIEGRIAWTNAEQRAGIEFRCRDLAGMRRLRELVKRIERVTVHTPDNDTSSERHTVA